MDKLAAIGRQIGDLGAEALGPGSAPGLVMASAAYC